MKNAKMRWLPLLLLATTSLIFPACEGNNPVNGEDEDLENVTTVYMKSGEYPRGNPTYIHPFLNVNDTYWFYIDQDNNFYGTYDLIIDVGKKKISQINTLPTSGWQRKIAVIPGHGYIMNLASTYFKLYVVAWIKDTYGGIIGAEVQYCEWTEQNQSIPFL